MIKYMSKKMFAVMPVLLLAAAMGQIGSVKAWDGEGSRFSVTNYVEVWNGKE
jgi:hypothetical protein